MTVAVIPFWIPLIWAFIVAVYWRYKIKKPINNYWVCALVFALNFFFFAWAAVITIIVLIFKSGILFKDKKEDDSEQ